MEIVIGLLIGIIGGVVATFLIQNVLLKKKREQIIKSAETEGESIKKEKILVAKEKFLKLKVIIFKRNSSEKAQLFL